MSTNQTPESQKKPSVYLQNREEVEKVFNRFDANGDGKISVSELGSVLDSLGSIFSSSFEVQRILDEVDSDRDGFISLPEFASFCRAGSKDGGASELLETFNLYDKDQNGLISAGELHLVLNRLGMKCSLEDCHRMIKSVDSDGDGNVNLEEFEKMMTNVNNNNGSAPWN